MRLVIAILAAGEGKRMKSGDFPKALHSIANISLLEHVFKAVSPLALDPIFIVCGHGKTGLYSQLTSLKNICWIEQPEQLGTADAVKHVLPYLSNQDRLLILYVDTPLIQTETLKNLIQYTPEDSIGWLTAVVKNPGNLGRIVRDSANNPLKIVEAKDASAEQRTINEINTGICLIPVKYLKQWLPELTNNNKQGEHYLTDLFEKAIQNKIKIITSSVENPDEILGANDHAELAKLERIFQKNQIDLYLKAGLKVIDPARLDIRGKLVFGINCTIDINVVLEGDIQLGKNCYIGPNVILRNTRLGENTRVEANSIIEDSSVGDGCIIGPFARLRPENQLASNIKIGNFVEIKKSTIGEGTKINHLSYIGDAELGEKINIGAGMITCNYDGANKYRTIIEDGVFVGSCVQLVAPIKIGENATIGAGSTLTQDAPPNKLTLARNKQITIEHWERPKKRAKKGE